MLRYYESMPEPTTTLTLSGADAERLARIVKSGGYASPEAAVADALATLEDSSDPALDAWLRDVVAQRCDANAADPTRNIPLDEAHRRLLSAD